MAQSHKMSVFLSCHKVSKLENIVSKNSTRKKVEHAYILFPQSLKKKMKILSSGPSELPRKFYVCEISLKKLKQYAHLREGGSEGAHLGRMCSPLIHKQIPFHVLSAQKDLWRLRNRKQNSVESVGHFLFPAFPCTCPLPAR